MQKIKLQNKLYFGVKWNLNIIVANNKNEIDGFVHPFYVIVEILRVYIFCR